MPHEWEPGYDGHVGVREDNRRRTTERIVEVAGDLVRSTGRADFTMPQVAAAADVGLRTLYRYFPTRDDLVGRMALLADQVQASPPPATVDEIEPWLVRAWRNLLADGALLRAQHRSEAGLELRRRRQRHHRAATETVVDALAPALDAGRRADVVDVVLLVCSSTALFEYVDVIDVDVDRAARLSAEVVRSMLSPARATEASDTA